MHPLVRDLYKRAILVGRDYPHPEGLEYVRRTWKAALRNQINCPSSPIDERVLRKAVGKGRFMIREMEGVIQLKKYRTLRKRYGDGYDEKIENERILKAIEDLADKQKH